MESTPAPATPRRMLAPAPLNNDRTPSLAMIWRPASRVPLYLTAYDVGLALLRPGDEGNIAYLAGSHHHTPTDSVEGVRSNTSTGSDGPAEEERCQEVTLKRTDKEDGLDRVVHAEVQTTVDDDTGDGRHETTVETSETISSEGLLVDIDQTVELTGTTSLGVLVVVGKAGTGVVERVDEEKRSSTSGLSYLVRSRLEALRDTYTTGSQVTSHPFGISIALLLVREHRLVGVAEREVEGLGREVSDDVGSITSPQRSNTLVLDGTSEAFSNAIVLAVETTRLKHLILK